MKKHIIFPFVVLGVSVTACQKAGNSAPTLTDNPVNEESLFHQAAAYGDLGSAAMAAHRLCFQRPDEAGKWKEELAKIYFAGGNHGACLKVCADVASNHGSAEKTGLQELQALALEASGRREEALRSWRSLFDATANPIHAVRLAGLQFEAGDLEGTRLTIGRALEAPEVEILTVPLPKTREEMQQVPVAAALQNLKGLLAMTGDEPDRAEARRCFETALALLPDFELAKRNLAGVVGEK